MTRFRDEVEAIGLHFTTETVGGTRRHTVTAECAACDRKEQHWFPADAGAERVSKWFRQRGWSLGSSIHCPQHAISKRTTLTMPVKPTATPLRQPTTKEVLTVGAILITRFHVEPGRYDDGWSDARVADEAKCPVGIVEVIRNEGFGPLKVDPAVEALKGELVTLKGMFAEWEKRLAAVENGGRR